MPSILPAGFSFLFCSSHHPVCFFGFFFPPKSFFGVPCGVGWTPSHEAGTAGAVGGVLLTPRRPIVTPETGGAVPRGWGGGRRDLPPNAWGDKLQDGGSLLVFSLALISLSYSHLRFYV